MGFIAEKKCSEHEKKCWLIMAQFWCWGIWCRSKTSINVQIVCYVLFILCNMRSSIFFSPNCFSFKVEKILKVSLVSNPSDPLSVKIQIMDRKVCLRCKSKTLLGVLFSKLWWHHPAMFCLITSRKLYPPIIWIFTKGEGDGIESRLSS